MFGCHAYRAKGFRHMSKYVITITQDPAQKSGSQTTVRVDLSSGQPRVQELLVRSGDDRGLASADLPPIDLGMLIRALSGAGAGIEGVASSTSDTTSVEPATTRRAARGKKKAAAPRSRARSVTRDSKSRSRRAASDGSGAERAYRRMPDPDEVLSVYQETGTITGLAQHFGVPRHTAQGWAGRLRRNGYQIGRH
jgi:hypothetical protein